MKLPELVPVPADVVTEIGPLVAPPGTVAEICDAETTVKDADVPLNAPSSRPVKFEPEIVTAVPGGPLVGENDETAGACACVVPQEGNEKCPIRVLQSSVASEVGCVA